ncbi:hypothetical protein [Sphingopyxis sp. KK2]|uniref:hypothetical protein n=1 Tax=Sphingopyxis sp. KK2 TaxID=1855727 RepID=UPI001181BE6E|nr:hypothetical protein [Sphingopyxis sp. KK2]
MRGRSFANLVAVLALTTPAHAIPPPPSPPDPAVMDEAHGLARELVAPNDGDLRFRTRSAVANEALGWLAVAHPDVRDQVVLQAFIGAVQARVDAVWPEEQANIYRPLVNQFRLMSATDLADVRRFVATPAGQQFSRLLVDSYFGLADRAASDTLYRRLFPELPAMLEAAQKQVAG